MKTTNLLGIMLLLVLTPGAFAATGQSALDASLLYYQPVPAQPGDVLDVWIQVENTGSRSSGSGTLTIINSDVFSVESEEDRVSRFKSVPVQEQFLIQTKVRVAKGANEGANTLTVRVQEDSANSHIERRLSIPITGTTSTLSIVSAKTEPEEILPGQNAQLKLLVRNIGQTKVRNLDITVDFAGLSFAPLGGSNSQTIATLEGGEQQYFLFKLVSYPDAQAQAYRLPVTLAYDDEQGNEKEQNETIGIVIGAKPELLVYFEAVDLTEEKKEGTVVLKFVNKGLAEIKLLEMEILENANVKVTGESPVIYVGNIDEDDYESAELKLAVTDETTVPVRLAYKDALNREYEEQIELPLRLQKKNGNGGGSKLGPFVGLVLLAGAGYWFIKRRRKK